MENSLLLIFGEIWPTTLCYSTGCLARFLTTLKIYKKNSILIRNLECSSNDIIL